MKKVILSLFVAVSVASCGMLAGTSNTASTSSTTEAAAAPAVSAATTAGQAAGNALHALYTQYKADGKYDYKNVQNAMNATLLLANCAELPSNYKNGSYLKEFGAGLVASSAGLVTQQNVNQVTDNLTTMAKEYANATAEKVATSETANKAASTANSVADKVNSAAQTASSVASILSLFAK